jgi:hypothetical protein
MTFSKAPKFRVPSGFSHLRISRHASAQCRVCSAMSAKSEVARIKDARPPYKELLTYASPNLD